MIEEIKTLREDGLYFIFVHDIDCQAVACKDSYLGWYPYKNRPYEAIRDIMTDLKILKTSFQLVVGPAPDEAFEGLDYTKDEEGEMDWEDDGEDQEDYQDCFCGAD